MKPKTSRPINNKPNIGILMNSFWNSGEGISGGDVRLIQIFERIGTNFGRIDIYTCEQAKKIIEKRIKNASFIISNPKFDTGNVMKAYLGRASWAKREIMKRKYDYLYASSDFFTDVDPCSKYIEKYPETKWIQCIFHVYPDWKKRPGSKLTNFLGSMSQERSFKKIGKGRCSIININTQVTDYLVEKKKFERSRIYLNPCGVDLDYFYNLKAEKKSKQGVFLARLKPSKGIYDLVGIWQEVVKFVPEAKLFIIGGGSEDEKIKLEECIKQAQLTKNIALKGFMEQDEAFKLVKSSDVFVFPSHEEGFGMAIAEAMACGLPAVTWDLPVYKEVFPTGLISVKENNISAFAKAVIRLFTDSNLAIKISADAKKMAKKYSLDGIAEKEVQIIFDTKERNLDSKSIC